MKKPFENAGQQFDAENSSQKDAFEEAQAQVLGPTSNYRAPSDQADDPEKLRLTSPADMGSAAKRTQMKRREAPPRREAQRAPSIPNHLPANLSGALHEPHPVGVLADDSIGFL